MKPLLLSALLLLTLACSKTESVDRAKWLEMSPDDRMFYVQTLIGEAQEKDAKEGRTARYQGPVNQYVKRIDEAYERGETRPVPEVFAEMTD